MSSVLEGGARSLVAAEGGVRCACAMGVRAPAPGTRAVVPERETPRIPTARAFFSRGSRPVAEIKFIVSAERAVEKVVGTRTRAEKGDAHSAVGTLLRGCGRRRTTRSAYRLW